VGGGQDAYEFHECVVESWNATESVFHVRVLSNDLRKPVKRLNLIFAAEDRAQHERMVVSAKTRREEAEAAYRYWLYIDNLDVTTSTTLSPHHLPLPLSSS
jgi:hypothetical protein